MELSDNLLGGRRGTSVAGVVINIILALVLLALVAVLIVTSSFSLCRISGDSMESTLHDGQYVLVGKGGETLSRGDVLVFSMEENGETTQLIKRVIATAGDTVRFERTDGLVNAQISDGGSVMTHVVELYVNGELLDEPYIREPMYAYYWAHTGLQIQLGVEYTVPDGTIFALGDNRNESMDSRYESVGFVPLTDVVGRVDCVLEPGGFLEWLVTLIYGVPFRPETA